MTLPLQGDPLQGNTSGLANGPGAANLGTKNGGWGMSADAASARAAAQAREAAANTAGRFGAGPQGLGTQGKTLQTSTATTTPAVSDSGIATGQTGSNGGGIVTTPGAYTSPGTGTTTSGVPQMNPATQDTQNTNSSYSVPSTLASTPAITGGPDPNSLGALGYYNAQTNTGNTDPSTVNDAVGVQNAYRTADGSTLANDPSLQATMDAFNKYQAPLIQNQMALSGLGNSNATGNALALSQSQQLAPAIQAALGREQETLGRGASATEAELQRRQHGIDQESAANLATIPYLMQMGNNDYTRQLGQINAADQFGQEQRGVQQEQNDAAYQDFLRRQGLSEQATYGPFGQTVPSAFGSISHTSKG